MYRFLGNDGKYHPHGSFLGTDGRYHPSGSFLGRDGKYHLPGSFLGTDGKYHKQLLRGRVVSRMGGKHHHR